MSTRCVSCFGSVPALLLTLLRALPTIYNIVGSVYWRPVFNLVEADERTVVLVNPQHMRAVPGRKTDVKDSEWLADRLRHGLVQPSFIPPAPIRALRELTRHRKALVQQRTQEVNRLQQLLEGGEGANIKLGAVATDLLGKSGRGMLDALARGEQDPHPGLGRAGSGPAAREVA
jgi:transposase